MFSELKLRNEIKNALEDLTENNIQTHTPDTGVTSGGYCKTLESFHTTLLTRIWNEILQRVDKISEILQREELDFRCTKKLQTFYLGFYLKENSNFYDSEAKALQLADSGTLASCNAFAYEKSEKGNSFQMRKETQILRECLQEKDFKLEFS
ncbi:hypothetical protein TNCV_3427931 [Trichonephila clavipes]|nr:hypothetical protein TNCV_3427931 [Trichonephila clavipes]